ncbi:hypothetical protein ABNN70_00735 [Sporolactobacillus sp. Y61]|uniref:Uncharacterized protein n=1 Tax=Sporolactobacillus sp. Y61 TaxID=3160863 RepID=A0AAU8IG14_9BACL
MILVGDGVKYTKEARRMPGVKKLCQESEDVSRARFIFGHLWGAGGVLVGTFGKVFCLPLFLNLQDGVKNISSWADEHNTREDSHVVQMVDHGYATPQLKLWSMFFFSLIIIFYLFLRFNMTRSAELGRNGQTRSGDSG